MAVLCYTVKRLYGHRCDTWCVNLVCKLTYNTRIGELLRPLTTRMSRLDKFADFIRVELITTPNTVTRT